MSWPANGSRAVALIQPSPFDVLPAPPLRARYLRNQRRLQRLSLQRLSGQTEAGLQWEAEVARQLGDEGFVVLDGFLGAEGAAQVRAAVVSALESAATAGGLSGGAPCHAAPRCLTAHSLRLLAHAGGVARRLRGDRTLWAAPASSTRGAGSSGAGSSGAGSSGAPLDRLLLRGLDRLVAHALRPRLAETRDLLWRGDAQLSLYPAGGSRYVRHVDNTCSGGRGRRCNGRRLSAVYYLNPSWSAADGSTA